MEMDLQRQFRLGVKCLEGPAPPQPLEVVRQDGRAAHLQQRKHAHGGRVFGARCIFMTRIDQFIHSVSRSVGREGIGC